MRLALELALARAAGRLSRLAGRGGGTTLPGSCSQTIDPGAVSALAGRLPLGTAIVSATNGKTTTAAMVAGILVAAACGSPTTSSGANLVSGVASTLLDARGAELGLFEVDEGALPGRRAAARGRAPSASATSSATSSTATASWSSSPSGGATAVAALPDGSTLVVNADDPLVADLARRTRRAASRSGWTTLARRWPALQHAADSKYCLALRRRPTCTRPRIVGHLGDYRCPACGHGRPALDVAARAIELHGLERVSFDLVTPRGHAPDPARPARPLQRLQRARGRRARAGARARASTRSRPASPVPRPAFGRFERIEVGDRAPAPAPDQEPGGRQRGRSHARRGRRAEARRDRAQRRDRRRARRLLDLGRRLRAAARRPRAARRLAATGRRSWRCAASTRAGRRTRSRSCRDLERALDRGLALTPPGRRAGRAAHVHGDARRCGRSSPAAATSAQYWERAA